MLIKNDSIDNGKAFDWGRVSAGYAKYRDIYPSVFYERIADRGLCVYPQRVLDVGTGTGVLPRNMYKYNAKWTGADISEEQIKYARILSSGMDIDYCVTPAENISLADGRFDVITACQCFWYFDHKRTAPLFHRLLKPGGHLLFLYMAWLPFEDGIAKKSEDIVLKYSPDWSGAGETIHPIHVPDVYKDYFDLSYHEEYPLKVHFTRESWHGRMKACRGVGASLTEAEITQWENEHIEMLKESAPAEFDIQHYAAVVQLDRK